MIHPTDNPAFLIRENSNGFVPLLYPFQRKDGTWIEIKSCVNRSPIFVMKCALRWLDKEDSFTRLELSKRGPDYSVRAIPDMESGPLSMLPDEYFETEDIYG